jgi:hypothetical protein
MVCLEGMRKSKKKKKLARIDDVLTKITTEHFLNVSVRC